MTPPPIHLAKTVADVMASTQQGSFGPVLRGLLVAITALRHDGQWSPAAEEMCTKVCALAELVENATVYAERNNL